MSPVYSLLTVASNIYDDILCCHKSITMDSDYDTDYDNNFICIRICARHLNGIRQYQYARARSLRATVVPNSVAVGPSRRSTLQYFAAFTSILPYVRHSTTLTDLVYRYIYNIDVNFDVLQQNYICIGIGIMVTASCSEGLLFRRFYHRLKGIGTRHTSKYVFGVFTYLSYRFHIHMNNRGA